MEVIGHRVVRVTPSRHAVTVEIDQGRQDDPRMTKKSDSVLRTLARLAVELVVLGAGLGWPLGFDPGQHGDDVGVADGIAEGGHVGRVVR